MEIGGGCIAGIKGCFDGAKRWWKSCAKMEWGDPNPQLRKREGHGKSLGTVSPHFIEHHILVVEINQVDRNLAPPLDPKYCSSSRKHHRLERPQSNHSIRDVQLSLIIPQ